MRAVTSADVPAGNSTVISTLPRFANGTSCVIAGAAVASATAPAMKLTHLRLESIRSFLRALPVTSQWSLEAVSKTRFLPQRHRGTEVSESRFIEHLGDGNAASLAGRRDAGQQHRQRSGGSLAVHLGLASSPHRGCEFLELLHDRVIARARYRLRAIAAPLQKSQALV